MRGAEGRQEASKDNVSGEVHPAVFESFPKIPRLRRSVSITEKIDGTNAQILIGADGTIRAGSRNRWITPDADNFGFARWVAEHEAELRELGPGRHFGEWWGSGIQRGYGLTGGEKRFSLFNADRWRDGRAPRPACCGVVPVLYEGQLESAVDAVLASLCTTGSVAAPGFMKPEGVVIFHRQAQHLYKVTLENDESPKGAES